MASKNISLNGWFDSLFDTMDRLVFTGTGTGTAPYKSYTTYPLKPLYILEDFTKDFGNPWNSLSNFPPCDVSVNTETKALKYEFALAGVSPDLVELLFEDDYMILKFLEDKSEKDTSWGVLKHGIKRNVTGEYKYEVPAIKYNIENSRGFWSNGLLVVTIPLREERKPIKVAIKTQKLLKD